MLARQPEMTARTPKAIVPTGSRGRANAEFVVCEILRAQVVEEIHNHHNFAWQEEHDGER
jgi:hypothetical protein